VPKVAQSIELDAIERLEVKIRKLIATIEQSRAEQARLVSENKALSDELGTLRKKVVESEDAASEAAMLREEREHVRARVGEMLAQLDALEL
jgi:regulator of replication initiation timing